MKCPICATEISNTVTSCPVCGRIMAAEQPKDSDVFSIDDALKPLPVEISQSEILKSMMKYNAQPQPKVEEEAPQLKEEAVAPVQEHSTTPTISAAQRSTIKCFILILLTIVQYYRMFTMLIVLTSIRRIYQQK